MTETVCNRCELLSLCIIRCCNLCNESNPICSNCGFCNGCNDDNLMCETCNGFDDIRSCEICDDVICEKCLTKCTGCEVIACNDCLMSNRYKEKGLCGFCKLGKKKHR